MSRHIFGMIRQMVMMSMGGTNGSGKAFGISEPINVEAKLANPHFNWREMPWPNLTDEQRLLFYVTKDYQKFVRPVMNVSKPVHIQLGLTLIHIFDMDEKNQVLTTNVWIDQQWEDDFMKWEPSDYGGLTSIRIPEIFLWTPDIVLYNNADHYYGERMESRAMVYYNGTIFWPIPSRLKSTCRTDVTYFPFDSQHCYLKFGSWTYHGDQVNISFYRNTGVDLSAYVKSGEFDLISTNQIRRVVKYSCCENKFPDIIFFIHIQRKILFYVYNAVLPCSMLTMLTLLVFWLPPDSGEKITLGVTVLLAFSVFMLNIAERMPETSDSLPLIGIYLIVVMGITSISVLMTVLVLNSHYRGPLKRRVPRWMQWLILDKLRRFLSMSFAENNVGGDTPLKSASDFSIPPPHSLMGPDFVYPAPPKCLLNGRGKNGKKVNMTTTTTGNNTLITSSATSDELDEEFDNEMMANNINSKKVRLIDDSQPGVRKKSSLRRNKKGSSDASGSKLEGETLRTLNWLRSSISVNRQSEDRVAEWRKIAEILDRLLFWIFLLITVIITFVLLILIPIVTRNNDVKAPFNVDDYGISLPDHHGMLSRSH